MGEEKEKIKPTDNGQEINSNQIKSEIILFLKQFKIVLLIMLLLVIAIIVILIGDKKYNWFETYELIIIIPTLICSMGLISQRFNVSVNLSKKQIRQLDVNLIINLVNIIALAVFAYCFFKKNVVYAILIGIILLVANVTSLVKTFLSKNSALKKLLPFDIIVPFVMIICLLWLLEDEKLQNIVTAIVASLCGGFLTLLGVAWTIKRQDEIRKEEEKKKAKPYLRLVEQNSCEEDSCVLKWSNFTKVDWLKNELTNEQHEKLIDTSKKLIAFINFSIELLSDNLCKIIGLEINNIRFNLNNIKILVKNNVASFSLNDILVVSEFGNVKIIVCDIYDRLYSYKVELEFDGTKRFERVKEKNIYNESAYFEDDLSYNVYKIVNIGMPEEIEKEGK